MELYLKKSKEAKVGDFYNCSNVYNCDVEAYDAESDDIIFCLKKNVIDSKYYEFDEKLVKLSKMESVNRGNAAGKVTISGLQRGKEHWKAFPVALTDAKGNDVTGEKSSAFFKYNDGRISKRARSNSVQSFALGGFDKSPQHPCRLTHYTKKHLEEYKTIFPLCQKISELYFNYFPDKWLYQYGVYEESPEEFLVPETNFSTITLNHDFTGGELIFPEYDIAVNIEEGDLLIFNPHEAHCNNPLKGNGRMSMVFYLREKMHLCS